MSGDRLVAVFLTTSSADRWANRAMVAIISMLAYFVVINHVKQLLSLFVVIAMTVATVEAYRAGRPERQADAAPRVLQPTRQTPRATRK